jgi:hypothetical protein
VEVIWQVRLCEVVSVSCNATMIPIGIRASAPMRGCTCAGLYEGRVSDHTSSRAGTGSARRRRLLIRMQVLVLVRWTLIDTTLVCSGSSKSPRMFLHPYYRNDPPVSAWRGTAECTQDRR